MTDYESKTNKELNEIAALRCGWISVYREYARRVVWFSSDWKEKHHDVGAVAPPDYTDPLNLGLCFRDFQAQIKGMYDEGRAGFGVEYDYIEEEYVGWIGDVQSRNVTNPARAFTIAFLAATDGY